MKAPQRLELAFSLAEKKLGVERLIDVEDIVEMDDDTLEELTADWGDPEGGELDAGALGLDLSASTLSFCSLSC